MQQRHSAKFLRNRKFMLVLPLLTIPFLTMAFWVLGGGKDSGQRHQEIAQAGLNIDLPDASLDDEKGDDKLSFYNKAREDSIRLRQEMLNDPFYKNGLDTIAIPEAKIYERIEALNKAIQQPTETEMRKPNSFFPYQKAEGQFSNDVERLEHMMQVMNSKEKDDPEIRNLEKMLDKVLDIQHPERVKEKIKEQSIRNKEMVFAISRQPLTTTISLLDTSKNASIEHNGFYGLDEDRLSNEQNAIEAVVHQNQTLVTGAVIKLRLLNDIYIAGTLIPKENFVFGIASLNGERLQIDINSIRTGSLLFPVKLKLYDMDGLSGIYIPGAITRDVAKQSADKSLELMELSTMDPSLKAQATAAGINATKTLLSKKAKLVSVMVKAGYKVLLKDQKYEQ